MSSIMTPFVRGDWHHFLHVIKTRSKKRMKYSEAFPVHCVCRMIEMEDRHVVECSRCLEWFHVDCLKEVLQDVVELGH